MRDPHVVRLHYKLHVDHSLLFERDTDVDRGAYRLHRHAREVEAEMVDHFASVAEVRDVVERDLRGWAIYPALVSRQRQFFRFEFVRSEVVDRAPPEPPPERGVVLFGAGIESTAQVGACMVTVSPPSAFPDPPARFRCSVVVETLCDWYQRCLTDERLGPAAGYLALTLVKTHVRPDDAPGGKVTSDLVADALKVERSILNKLHELSTDRGDLRTARKVSDKAEIMKPRRALYGVELQWIAEAIRMLALRVGEWDADPGATLPRVTLGELPRLP